MSLEDLSRLVRDFATPVKTVLHPEKTIEDSLGVLRELEIKENIIYFYAVDDDGKLLGVVPTRKLLLRKPHTRVKDIMETDIIALRADQNLHSAMEELESHHLLALPVTDRDGHFLGVIDVSLYLEESLDVARAKRRKDIFQLIGISIEEGKREAPFKSYLGRMPWIFCNMFGGFACAIIAHRFELVLSQMLLLAMFIPLTLSLSESISMQSMTQSMHLIQKSHHHKTYLFRRLSVEWRVIIMLALSCGILVGLISLLWGDGVMPGLSIGLGIIISVIISGFIGSVVPVVLHARNWDPKVAAGPIVLTCADVLTTTIYPSLATWWLLV